MEPHERVGVVPVPAGVVSTIDEDHVRVGCVHERIGERETGGAGAHDQVVGLEIGHRVPSPSAWRAT